jgi:hypothetical protein
VDRQFSRAVDFQPAHAKGDGFWPVLAPSKRNGGEMPPELKFAVAAENRNRKESVVHSLLGGYGEIHPEIGPVGDHEHQGRDRNTRVSLSHQRFPEAMALVG